MGRRPAGRARPDVARVHDAVGVRALPALPLTASRKVHRKALRAPEDAGAPARQLVAPATPFERRLYAVWQEILGVERFGVEDSFFDLGGHSLLVMKLLSRIHALFGVRLGPRHIFQNPSVRRLAQVVVEAQGTAPAAWDPLVDLSDLAAGPRLYCVPGAGMLSLALQPLARALAGSMALSAFEARGLDGREPPQTEIAALVESYGTALRRRQPEGPYHLAGHSFGGCVVVELARWLEARGAAVTVTMLDSFLDYFSAPSRDDRGDEAFAGPLAHLDDSGELPDPMDGPAVAAWMERVLAAQGVLPDGYESLVPGFAAVFLSQLDLQRRYRPSGELLAPVTLLHATEGAMVGERLAGVLAAYARITAQPVRHFAVAGNHLSMLSTAHAPLLAARLREVLAPSLSGAAPATAGAQELP